MKSYTKLVLVTLVAVAAAFAVTARAATIPPEPVVIVLPATALADALRYLSARPYQEVAGIIGEMQRCLQDQVPDNKGVIAEHGNCPEVSKALRHIKADLPHEPPPHPAVDKPAP